MNKKRRYPSLSSAVWRDFSRRRKPDPTLRANWVRWMRGRYPALCNPVDAPIPDA